MLFLNVASVSALPRAEVSFGDPNFALFVQENDKKFDGFGVDFNLALSEKIAVNTTYIVFTDRDDEKSIGEFNLKYNIEQPVPYLEVAPFVGWHRTDHSDENDDSFQFGSKITYRLSEFSSAHGSATYLTNHDEQKFGYAVGFDYVLSTGDKPSLIEIGYRQMTGVEDSELGLTIGFRQFFGALHGQ